MYMLKERYAEKKLNMMNKNIFKSIALSLILVSFVAIFYNSNSVSAQTYALTKEYNNVYLFAVPEGGWSSITVDLNYVERYTKYDASNNKYYSRECLFAYKTAYATSKPGGEVLTIKHYSGSGRELHNFTKWNDMAVIIEPGYDFVWSKMNGKNKFYLKTTNNYAHVAFQVSCNGAVPAIQTGGLKMNLKAE